MTTKPGRRSAAARAALARSKATPPPPNPGAWRQLADGWHVELVPGASLTRCNVPIPADARSSPRAMPTACDPCRKHARAGR